MNDIIRLARPPIGDEELDATLEVLRSGYLVQGSQVSELENELARFTGSSDAVAVGSGTAALHLSLIAMGIGPGDHVITTTYSWPATANAIELVGATPKFVDIDPESLNLDLEQLERSLSAIPGAAVMPVHAFGNSVDMTRLGEIAEHHGARVIEDAACAIGGSWDERSVGSFGEVGCFSFHPRKIVTSGEGGLVISNNARLTERVRSLRDHGITRKKGGQFEFGGPGFNYRMTDIGAALLRPQLRKLPGLLEHRRELARSYANAFVNSAVRPQALSNPKSAAIQALVVSIDGIGPGDRDSLIVKLRSERIETSIATIHVPLTRYYSERYGYRPGDFPVTDRVHNSSIALPLHNAMEVQSVEFVADSLLNLVP